MVKQLLLLHLPAAACCHTCIRVDGKTYRSASYDVLCPVAEDKRPVAKAR